MKAMKTTRFCEVFAPKSQTNVNTRAMSCKVYGFSLLSSSLQSSNPFVGVESKWCTLVTDQTSEGNGMDTQLHVGKLVQEEDGLFKSGLSHVEQTVCSIFEFLI